MLFRSADLSDRSAAAQIRAGLGKDFPTGFQFKPDVSTKPAVAPVDATVCQQLFSELLGKAKIRFESGRATIDPDSAGLLDHLVETASRCPTANIEVAGHTDADGDDAANQELSERRAQAVVDDLDCRRIASRRLVMAAHNPSPPMTPRTAKRRTAALNSW